MKKILYTKRPIKIWTEDIEPEAQEQLERLARLPFIYKHISVMPDVHAGRGSTIGTVIATKGAIIPSAVGVDIGCGMSAVRLSFNISDVKNLSKLRSSIERSIPVGRFGNSVLTKSTEDQLHLLGKPNTMEDSLFKKASLQLGSLGGGNHFIELCEDEVGGAWVMLHSGSRHVGKTLADIHINSAKNLMKRYFIDLPDPELAYLAQNTEEFKAYINDLHWAQGYAKANRAEMMSRVLKDISHHMYHESREISVLRIDCHHNYTSMENHFGSNVWITRKGAVSAKEGQLGIIPGSMGDKSYIVKGLGNKESFCSCAHGAGRRMSRTKAKAVYSREDLIEQTKGVECRKDEDLIDEIPGAYKNIDEVMDNQKDLVTPIVTLKQVMCIKG